MTALTPVQIIVAILGSIAALIALALAPPGTFLPLLPLILLGLGGWFLYKGKAGAIWLILIGVILLLVGPFQILSAFGGFWNYVTSGTGMSTNILVAVAVPIVAIVAIVLLLIFVADFRKLVLPLVGIAIIIGAVALWIGWDNFTGVGRNIGGGLTNLTSGTLASDGGNLRTGCAEEKVVTLPIGASVTVERNPDCSKRVNMKWRPMASATVDIAGIGNLGPYHYVRLPDEESSFNYEGITEMVTFTNLGTAPTTVLVYYR